MKCMFSNIQEEKEPLQIKCLTRFLKILNQKEVQNFLNLMKY